MRDQQDPLIITHPEIALEWHPIKNGIFGPCDVVANSRVLVWWLCHADGHAFKQPVNERVTRGCSHCRDAAIKLLQSVELPDMPRKFSWRCPDELDYSKEASLCPARSCGLASCPICRADDNK